MSRAADPAYLRCQYSDDERLRLRLETHERYSESRVSLVDRVLPLLAALPGHVLVDVGSGPGVYHDRLRDVRVIAVDLSIGMLRKVGTARVQADAQALPLRDACADRVMANHMLYHVPDRLLALREMRRVLKPGGCVVLATNERRPLRRLFELYEEVAAPLGATLMSHPEERFSLDDLDLVRVVFPQGRVERFEDALVFPDPEPVLAYLASGPASQLAPDARAAVFDALEARIRAIVAREGAFRVPKVTGCFVADV